MNIDRDIADRAFLAVGEPALNSGDIGRESERYRMLKTYYLQTILEALSEVPWTRAKKRVVLEKSEDENLSPYRYAYVTPVDCARPLEMQNNEYFIVEGDRILTDLPDAVLLYITNGRRTLWDSITETREDYPAYDLPEMEPKFYEYIEKMLAAKFAIKLTDKKNLYQTLFSAAMLIKDEAVSASKSASAAKKNGNPWWFEEIGVSGAV